MIPLRDLEKMVHSIARWLACLDPKWGPRHYFKKYDIHRVEAELMPYLCTLQCPFCGERFTRPSGFITHVERRHWDDIVDLIRRAMQKHVNSRRVA